MSLSAYVVHTEHSVRPEPALQREHVFLGVWNPICGGVVWKTGNRIELRPVYIRVRMTCTRIQGGECHRKSLARILAVRCRDKRRGKQRRRGTCVGCAVW